MLVVSFNKMLKRHVFVQFIRCLYPDRFMVFYIHTDERSIINRVSTLTRDCRKRFLLIYLFFFCSCRLQTIITSGAAAGGRETVKKKGLTANGSGGCCGLYSLFFYFVLLLFIRLFFFILLLFRDLEISGLPPDNDGLAGNAAGRAGEAVAA